jgi:hypothetical protein
MWPDVAFRVFAGFLATYHPLPILSRGTQEEWKWVETAEKARDGPEISRDYPQTGLMSFALRIRYIVQTNW